MWGKSQETWSREHPESHWVYLSSQSSGSDTREKWRPEWGDRGKKQEERPKAIPDFWLRWWLDSKKANKTSGSGKETNSIWNIIIFVFVFLTKASVCQKISVGFCDLRLFCQELFIAGTGVLSAQPHPVFPLPPPHQVRGHLAPLGFLHSSEQDAPSQTSRSFSYVQALRKLLLGVRGS